MVSLMRSYFLRPFRHVWPIQNTFIRRIALSAQIRIRHRVMLCLWSEARSLPIFYLTSSTVPIPVTHMPTSVCRPSVPCFHLASGQTQLCIGSQCGFGSKNHFIRANWRHYFRLQKNLTSVVFNKHDFLKNTMPKNALLLPLVILVIGVTDRFHEVQARMAFQAAFLVFLTPVAWLLPAIADELMVRAV